MSSLHGNAFLTKEWI